MSDKSVLTFKHLNCNQEEADNWECRVHPWGSTARWVDVHFG